ncbi:MAG: hypothetical protein IJB67_03460 [Firmicutes bacterium]|nr:hypothetical protein [Bacillota bacterium]
MKNLRVLVAWCCMLLPLLAGCDLTGDLKDVEMVRALSVDIIDNVDILDSADKVEAQENSSMISAAVHLLHRDRALEGQYAESYYQLTAEGDSLAAALGQLYDVGAKQLNFSHTSLLVLGEQAAPTEFWLDYALRSPQLRPTVYPVVCVGQIEALLAADEQTLSPIYLLNNLSEPMGSSYPGVFGVSLQDFVEDFYQTGIAPALPLVEKTADGVAAAGLAVYAGDKIALLTDDDAVLAWQLLVRTPYLYGMVLALDDGVAVRLQGGQIFIRLQPVDRAEDLRPVCELELQADILNNPAGLDTQQVRALLNERLQQILAVGMAKSRRLQADFLGIGREIWRKQPHIWPQIAEQDYLSGITVDLQTEIELNAD